MLFLIVGNPLIYWDPTGHNEMLRSYYEGMGYGVNYAGGAGNSTITITNPNNGLSIALNEGSGYIIENGSAIISNYMIGVVNGTLNPTPVTPPGGGNTGGSGLGGGSFGGYGSSTGGGRFPSNDTQNIVNNALAAAQALTDKYLRDPHTGEIYYNNLLLLKGEGPNEAQYDALSRFFNLTAFNLKSSNIVLSNEEMTMLGTWWVDVYDRLSLEERVNQMLKEVGKSSLSGANDPVIISVSGNTIYIDVLVDILGDWANEYSYAVKENMQYIWGGDVPDWAQTYSALLIAGLEEYWSGDFWYKGRYVSMKTTVTTAGTQGRNPLRIKVYDDMGQSNAYSGSGWDPTSVWEMGFYQKRPESDVSIYPWFMSREGYSLPEPYSDRNIRHLAGHEFGHVLGVETEVYNETPNSVARERDMMRYDGEVSSLDIDLMLKALVTHKVQEIRMPK